MVVAFGKFDNKIYLSSPTMHGDELKYMAEAYQTNWMSTVGANINEVERIICEKVGCKYAVGLSAGTAALHMAVKLAGVKPGEKVFVLIPHLLRPLTPLFTRAEYRFLLRPSMTRGTWIPPRWKRRSKYIRM